MDVTKECVIMKAMALTVVWRVFVRNKAPWVGQAHSRSTVRGVSGPMKVQHGVLVSLNQHVVIALPVHPPKENVLVLGCRSQVDPGGIELGGIDGVLNGESYRGNASVSVRACGV